MRARDGIVLGLIAVVAMTGSVRAQANKTEEQQGAQRPAQYILGTVPTTGAEGLLMNVNVWGFVQKPGQYLVPVETDLVSLLSFAGGPLQEASLSRIRLIKGSGNNGKQQVLNVDLQSYLEKGDTSVLPPLDPNDTVIVRAGKMYGVRQALDWIWRIAVVVQAYAIITYYLTRS